MPFGPTTIQPLAKLNFRYPIRDIDTAGTDHRDNEVYWMSRDHRSAQIEWNEAHQ